MRLVVFLLLTSSATLRTADTTFGTLCPSRTVDLSLETTVVLVSDRFQSPTNLESSICRFHVKSPHGVLVVVRNFFLFSHRRPKNAEEIKIMDGEGRLFVSQKLPVEEHFFPSDVHLQIPTNLNFRATVILTEGRLNCSKADGSRWSRCGGAEDVCVSSAVLCDGNENCANGDDEANCAPSGYSGEGLATPLLVNYRPFSSSLYMLIGFFLLNAFFVAFFIILAVCSLGFCYARIFYKRQATHSRRTFVHYLRSATEGENEERNEASQRIPEDSLPLPIPVRRHRESSIISRLNFQPEKTLEEMEPENEDRETEFRFERTFSLAGAPDRKISAAPEYCYPAAKRNSLLQAKISTKMTRNSYCSVMFNNNDYGLSSKH